MRKSQRLKKRLTPSYDTHAKCDEETGNPSQNTPGPREGEDSQTNILRKQEHRGLLPTQSSEFDLFVNQCSSACNGADHSRHGPAPEA